MTPHLLMCKNSSTLITAIIPAYNEEKRIGQVITKAKRYVAEVLVIDDNSSDSTARVARAEGARVIVSDRNRGYLESIKKGFIEASNRVLVTLDADGEHNPEDIPYLVQPILDDKADLVFGKRNRIPRISERFLSWLVNLKVKVSDPGTGFRALTRELALKLDLRGRCTCGVLALEANYQRARIAEVPVSLGSTDKKRGIFWFHFWQFFYTVPWLFRRPKPKIGVNEQ